MMDKLLMVLSMVSMTSCLGGNQQFQSGGYNPGGFLFSGSGFNSGSGYGNTNNGFNQLPNTGYGNTNNGFVNRGQNTGYGNTNNGLGNQATGYGNTNQGSGYGNTNQGSGYGSSGNNCPSQVDFASELQLSPDDANYPVTELNTELAARPDLAACFARTLILPNATIIPDDPVDHGSTIWTSDRPGTQSMSAMQLLTAMDTCSRLNQRLFSYFRYGNRCWIIPGVQESINYTTCMSQQCQGCTPNFFDTNQQGIEKRCVLLYKYFSVWVICLGLPTGSQIIKDRVILPYACTCNKVRCFANVPNYYKKK